MPAFVRERLYMCVRGRGCTDDYACTHICISFSLSLCAARGVCVCVCVTVPSLLWSDPNVFPALLRRALGELATAPAPVRLSVQEALSTITPSLPPPLSDAAQAALWPVLRAAVRAVRQPGHSGREERARERNDAPMYRIRARYRTLGAFPRYTLTHGQSRYTMAAHEASDT
jgi:hypothetical protein